MISIDITNIIVVGLAALGLIGTLIAYIVKIYAKKFEEMKATGERLVEKYEMLLGKHELLLGKYDRLVASSGKCDQLEERLREEEKARQLEHKESLVRVFDRIETIEGNVHQIETGLQSKVSDIEITIAGFGSLYASRKDLEHCQEKHDN